MRLKLFILFGLMTALLRAQNGVAISVSGATSVCPNQLYQYNIQIVSSNVCYIEVGSTGGHRVACGTAHNLSDTSPTSDFGSFMTPNYPNPFNIYEYKSVCMHWVSSGPKSLCFTAYNCSGAILSNFCITVNNNAPTMIVQGNTNVCNGQYAYFTAPCGLSNYAWSVVPDNFETYSLSGGGCVANIGNLTNNSWHLVQVQAVDCWGTTQYGSKSFWTVSCARDPKNEVVTEREESDNTAENNDTGIKVYPNPADQGAQVTVLTENVPVMIQFYQLYSVAGKLLKNGNVPDSANMFDLEMPETPGVYLLILTDANHRQTQHKVVVTQ